MKTRTRYPVFIFALALALSSAAPGAAQVQNPQTTTPNSPQNQCIPTHKRDAASQTNGVPVNTTVDSTANGSVPCPNNQPISSSTSHHHAHHHHHNHTLATPGPAPQ